MPPGRRVFGGEERDVFAQASVAEIEVLRVFAAVYHGLVAAAATDDLDAAGRALALIMSTGFKRLEVANQSEAVRGLVHDLVDATGMPVGMSSMGPLVYMLHRADDSAAATAAQCATKWGASVLCTTKPAREGHILES
jgi:beta-ribofuranosylaminobenzene 5'-phosphate synthase